MDRGLPIYPYYQDPLDTELYDLENFLQKLRISWENGADTSALIRDHFMYSEYNNHQDNQLELIMQILVNSHERAVKYQEQQQQNFKVQDPHHKSSEHDLKSEMGQEEMLKFNQDTQESDKAENSQTSEHNYYL